MQNRRFNRDSYLLNDKPGKRALISYFSKKGYTVTEEPFGKYDIDLAVIKDNRTIYLDAEVRGKWQRNPFPFKTVHIPYRKKKHLLLGEVYLCSIRNDKKYALFVPAKDIYISPIVYIKTMTMDQEPFFDVTIQKKYYINLEK